MKLLSLIVVIAMTLPAFAAVKTEEVAYTHGGVTLRGLIAYDDAAGERRPGVLVVHEWWGCNDYAKKRAAMLAEMGYVAFACDMYGEGRTTVKGEEAGQWSRQFQGQDDLRVGRMEAGLKVLREHRLVDAARLAAIGYCFGGTSVLKLACAGADVKAVVSFHGSLWDLSEAEAARIKCKVLICNGAADTFIPVDVKNKFVATLEAAKTDYQFNDYGGAVHSFTNPNAGKAGITGVAYQEAADRRSWADMKRLFDEAFAK
jgi:dienelactone hydrolase